MGNRAIISRFSQLFYQVVQGPPVLKSFPFLQSGKTHRSSIRPHPRTSIQWVSFIKSNPELPFFCPMKRRNENLALLIKFPTFCKSFKKYFQVCMCPGDSWCYWQDWSSQHTFIEYFLFAKPEQWNELRDLASLLISLGLYGTLIGDVHLGNSQPLLRKWLSPVC